MQRVLASSNSAQLIGASGVGLRSTRAWLFKSDRIGGSIGAAVDTEDDGFAT